MAEERGELPGSSPPSSPPEHEKNDKQSEASPESSPVTEEEKKKNARPERTATFQDYLVGTTPIPIRLFKFTQDWFSNFSLSFRSCHSASSVMPRSGIS